MAFPHGLDAKAEESANLPNGIRTERFSDDPEVRQMLVAQVSDLARRSMAAVREMMTRRAGK
ncbi:MULTISPECIES: hypothetical protein [unclassified Mameliella]|uniref:hypothetical protein n=1 Tax=unclassified Mameliella TaxID=2630630 RepID=UPI00273D1786|nr:MULTISPECIES: hypothetical protein [unclassified Mameliella]